MKVRAGQYPRAAALGGVAREVVIDTDQPELVLHALQELPRVALLLSGLRAPNVGSHLVQRRPARERSTRTISFPGCGARTWFGIGGDKPVPAGRDVTGIYDILTEVRGLYTDVFKLPR